MENVMGINLENNLKLDQFIADRLFFHLNQNNSITKSSISNSTGINRKTLDKLIAKEASLELVDSLKLLKLIKILTKDEFPAVFSRFKEQFLSLSRSYEAIFSFIDPEKFVNSNEAENHKEILDNRNSFIIFLLASSNNGTSIQEINSILGSQYHQNLDSLIQSGLLKRDGDLIINTSKDIYFSREFVKKNLMFINEFYNSAHAGKQRNYIFYTAQKVNQAGLKKCYEVMQNAHKEMLNIMKDPNYKGSIPFFSTGVMDTFVDEISEKGVIQ